MPALANHLRFLEQIEATGFDTKNFKLVFWRGANYDTLHTEASCRMAGGRLSPHLAPLKVDALLSVCEQCQAPIIFEGGATLDSVFKSRTFKARVSYLLALARISFNDCSADNLRDYRYAVMAHEESKEYESIVKEEETPLSEEFLDYTNECFIEAQEKILEFLHGPARQELESIFLTALIPEMQVSTDFLSLHPGLRGALDRERDRIRNSGIWAVTSLALDEDDASLCLQAFMMYPPVGDYAVMHAPLYVLEACAQLTPLSVCVTGEKLTPPELETFVALYDPDSRGQQYSLKGTLETLRAL